MTPAIELVEVSRRYVTGRVAVQAVDAVSLRVEAGEVVGLSGPSGCGKSTLLRLVSGVERPDAGRVLHDGAPADVIGGGRHRRTSGASPTGVAAVFQDPGGSLDPRWPVWRSASEPLTVRGRTRPSLLRATALDAFSRVGLGAISGDERPAELSGGQCQRVAIARALIARPRILVADEPTASLDVTTAAGILRVLREVATQDRVAMVVVSHDTAMLSVLCDRVQHMSDGRLVLPPAEPAMATGHRGGGGRWAEE